MQPTDSQIAGKSIIRPRQLKLITAGETIQRDDARSVDEIGFMARVFIQATMPHRDLKGISEFTKVNGKFTFVMMAPSHIGLPYGSIPRIILSWLAGEAQKQNNPVITLGRINPFMEKLGIAPTGGSKGSITMLKKQLKRLFSTSISCLYEDDKQWSNQGFRIADEAHLWWHPRDPEQLDLWESTVTLGSWFFQELLKHPVPVDMRALKALRRSPLELDIYFWLTYRMSRLQKNTTIPWDSLQKQFGADYSRLDNFKSAFLAALRNVLTIYSSARTQPLPHGLLLKPSSPHISFKGG